MSNQMLSLLANIKTAKDEIERLREALAASEEREAGLTAEVERLTPPHRCEDCGAAVWEDDEGCLLCIIRDLRSMDSHASLTIDRLQASLAKKDMKIAEQLRDLGRLGSSNYELCEKLMLKDKRIESLEQALAKASLRTQELEKALNKWPCGCLALGDCCPSCEARRALDGEEVSDE